MPQPLSRVKLHLDEHMRSCMHKPHENNSDHTNRLKVLKSMPKTVMQPQQMPINTNAMPASDQTGYQSLL